MKAESYALEIFTGHTDVYVIAVNRSTAVEGRGRKLAFVEEDAVTGPPSLIHYVTSSRDENFGSGYAHFY